MIEGDQKNGHQKKNSTINEDGYISIQAHRQLTPKIQHAKSSEKSEKQSMHRTYERIKMKKEEEPYFDTKPRKRAASIQEQPK